MILTPAIIALLTGLLLAAGMALYSALIGIRIIRSWDIRSGSERQLALERKTYLISTILVVVMGYQLFSLFLFIFTVDNLHGLFIGAMCAAGTLNVNSYGYSTLLLKVLGFFLCGVWLILNYTDNRAPDYPLIRAKYKFLLLITALILVEVALQYRYFMSMQPDLITSCCGTLFSEGASSLAADVVSLPVGPMRVAFFLGVILTLRSGIYTYWTRKGARVFAAIGTGFLWLALAALVSFISVTFYEQPTHHCPFCLLQKEYHYVGYPLYLSLFGAGIAAAGVGVLERYRHIPSLRETVPSIQSRLCLVSITGYLLFAAIASYPMLFSDFRLGGY